MASGSVESGKKLPVSGEFAPIHKSSARLQTDAEEDRILQERQQNENQLKCLLRSDKSDDKDCCFICLNNYDCHQRARTILPCGHTFCGKCLNRMIKEANHCCPLCRASWQTNSVVVDRSNVDLDEKELGLGDSETTLTSRKYKHWLRYCSPLNYILYYTCVLFYLLITTSIQPCCYSLIFIVFLFFVPFLAKIDCFPRLKSHRIIFVKNIDRIYTDKR